MNPNIIRSIIFFIAGLALLIFSDKIIEMQSKVLAKINVKSKGTKLSCAVTAIVFLIISVILFYFS